MLVLGIETSGTTGGAALLQQDKLLASLQFTSKRLYSQRLLPSIEWLFERVEMDVQQVTAIAVSIGPGSFTGLRIGLAAAKGLALATGAEIVGVNTLEALALRVATAVRAMPVCVVLDARQGQIYAALFRAQPSTSVEPQLYLPPLMRLREDFAGKLDEIADWFREPTVLAGEGALRYVNELKQIVGDNYRAAPVIRNLPSAEEVAYLGARRLEAGGADDLILLEPHYLRHSYIKG